MVEQPSSENDEIKNAIRRLRKKLRQIRNLERLQRSLSPEERVKVGSRGELQESLGRFLSLAEQFDVSAISDRSEHHAPHDGEEVTEFSESLEDGTGFSESLDDGTGVTEILEDRTKYELTEDVSPIPLSANSPSLIPLSANSPSPTHLPNNLTNTSPDLALLSQTATKTTKQISVKTPVKTKNPAATKPVKLSALWTELDAHQEDLIITTCITPSYLCSGGRDRCVTLLAPTPPHHPLLYTLGEHTDTVTSILLLPDSSILTASLDCSVKVWRDGVLLHSTYLYSPITAAAIRGDVVVLGTQGGKMMCYSTVKREVEWERVAHDDSVSAVEISEKFAFSASYNLVVWDLATQSKISEVEGSRKVGSCTAVGNTLYYCNGGPSVKEWREGRVRSVFRNTVAQHNSTDCVRVCGDLLLASVYELDSGSSVINVWNVKSSTYICTVGAPVFSITSIDIVSTSPNLYTALVAGTSTAFLTLSKSDRLSGVTFETGLRAYKKNECSQLDSESEDDSEDSDCSENEDENGSGRVESAAVPYYWCTIV